MGRLLNVVTPLHQMTKRDYIGRMVDDKVHCMLKAKEYEGDYWDGDRRYGYGGYRYIEGRWKPVAQGLIDRHGLFAPRVQAVIARSGTCRVRHLEARAGRRPSRRQGRAVSLPRAGRLPV